MDSLVLEELTDSDKELLKTSLKKYHSAKYDTSKINALSEICENMIYEDWTKYQFYQFELIEKKLKVTESIALKKSLAEALNNLGLISLNQGNIKIALQYYTKSLKIREMFGDKHKISNSLNNIGGIYQTIGKIKEALIFHNKSLKISEEIGDKHGIANSLNNISFIYKQQGQLKEALSYYNISLKIREEIDDHQGIANSLTNISFIYRAQGKMKKALYYINRSLKISERIGDKDGIANALNSIAGIYRVQGQLKEALYYANRSLKLNKEISDMDGIASSLNNISIIYRSQGKLKEALDYANRSFEISMEIGYPLNIKLAAKSLFNIFEQQGEGIKALAMHKLYIQMKDSLNNKETLKASIIQQNKYEYEKAQEIKDIELQKQSELNQQAKVKQKVIAYATLGVLALVGIFFIFVIDRLKVTRKQKSIIEEQKADVEKAHLKLEEKNKEVMDSISYAKCIQSAILPSNELIKENLKNSFILYKPKDVVSGDFYWLEVIDNKVLFAAADCTGHGVPGAMMSVICNNALNRSVRDYGLTDPSKILNKTREIIIQEFDKSKDNVRDSMDIALCVIEDNILQYAGAQHPLWIIRKGELLETIANKQPAGQYHRLDEFILHQIELEPNDSIYIFSDGYVDQFGGEKEKKFKAKAFRELLLSIQDKSMEEQKNIIDEAFETWRGSFEQIDDVCVIGVRV